MVSTEKLVAHWDYAAGHYHQFFSQGIIAQYLRQASLEILAHFFHPGQHLLEIGCGQGEEAVFLAKKGMSILATDISSHMLAQAQTLARQEGILEQVKFQLLSAEALESLNQEDFQGMYSSFGALNVVDDLAGIAVQAAKRVPAGGFFIASLLNRHCFFELGYHAARGRWQEAKRRLLPGAGAYSFNPDYPEAHCHYYTPKEFYQYFRKQFTWIQCQALPVFLPPLSWDSKISDKAWWLPWLLALDQGLKSLWPFNCGGDHFMLILRRR